VAKATIKSATGVLITVEGSEDEVAKILASYERMSVVGHAKQAIARSRASRKESQKREGAADVIKGLREAGFFDKPKALGDVAEALEEKGFLYPTTTLSGIMLGLVKKKHLRRKRNEGRWVYGK
jgi:hypothetical protein